MSVNISIHALRKECDRAQRGAQSVGNLISIHALRKECDVGSADKFLLEANFYPRTP